MGRLDESGSGPNPESTHARCHAGFRGIMWVGPTQFLIRLGIEGRQQIAPKRLVSSSMGAFLSRPWKRGCYTTNTMLAPVTGRFRRLSYPFGD